MMALPLSPQVFAIMSGLIEERTGIHYGQADVDLLAERLSLRAAERGFDSLLDYYYYLRYDPEGPLELESLVDALVVQETYFFREVASLEALVDNVLPERLAAAGPPVRVWSAACATGEEPLTLAMLLDQRGLLDRVELVATDISARGLARARSGTFGGRSLRALPEPARRAYMTDAPGGRVVLRRDLVERVTWRMLNLLDDAAVASLGAFDVILCRNVLIYFRDASILRVIASLAGALGPQGVLLVGTSESLMRFGGLKCEERGGAFFYRKPKVP